ncbi:signal peptidase I [Cladophialophora psammophila CBS 110553]|uniref:Signal peptidase complex catalytic subunit SEC11 n=1 Tax=Cladophialophora psammophila CBS 110553 TaxID=1182543 RepID=W9WRX1_9EURO|nr:signal peptidase I [Cladophialophora psammophila CBS 110553]EXJ67760.1 signal peptidase I [Cladophialophora psammophila CBS 110553]
MLPFLAPYLSNPRQSLSQVLNFALVLSTAFMLWKSLSVIADSPSPIVVVLSGSMEPAFQRGDLLFLWNRDKTAEVGEIVVYNVKGKDIPIVHRVVRSHAAAAPVEADKRYRHLSTLRRKESVRLILDLSGNLSKASPKLLTKGDNNVADDTELYARGQSYLDRKEDIIGSVRGYVPAVGYVTIMLSEHPWLKTVMLGIMGLMVILQRE